MKSGVLLYSHSEGSSLLCDAMLHCGARVTLYEELDLHYLETTLTPDFLAEALKPGIISHAIAEALGVSGINQELDKEEVLSEITKPIVNINPAIDQELAPFFIKWRACPADDPSHLSKVFGRAGSIPFIAIRKDPIKSAAKTLWNNEVSRILTGGASDHLQFLLLNTPAEDRSELAIRISKMRIEFGESFVEDIARILRSDIANLVHRLRIAATFPHQPVLVYDNYVKSNPISAAQDILHLLSPSANLGRHAGHARKDLMTSFSVPSFDIYKNTNASPGIYADKTIAGLAEIYSDIAKTVKTLPRAPRPPSPANSELSILTKIGQIKNLISLSHPSSAIDLEEAKSIQISQRKTNIFIVTFPCEYLLTLLQLWTLKAKACNLIGVVLCINKQSQELDDLDKCFVDLVRRGYDYVQILFLDQLLLGHQSNRLDGYRTQQLTKLAVAKHLPPGSIYIALDSKCLAIRSIESSQFHSADKALNNFEELTSYWTTSFRQCLSIFNINHAKALPSKIVSPVTPYALQTDTVRQLLSRKTSNGENLVQHIFASKEHPKVTEFLLYQAFQSHIYGIQATPHDLECPRRWSTIWPTTDDPIAFINSARDNETVLFMGLHRKWLGLPVAREEATEHAICALFGSFWGLPFDESLSIYRSLTRYSLRESPPRGERTPEISKQQLSEFSLLLS